MLGALGTDVGGRGVDFRGLGRTFGGWRATGDSPVKECHPSESKNNAKTVGFSRFFEGRGITKKGLQKVVALLGGAAAILDPATLAGSGVPGRGGEG